MDTKINIDTTYRVALLASRTMFVPQVNSVHITDAAIGGAFGTDAEFCPRSGPLLWSPPV